MALSQDDFERIVASIAAAPFQPGGWTQALKGTVEAGGGWGVQLLAQTPTGEMLFDVGYGVDSEILDTYESKGTSDPTLSPRTKAALDAPILSSFCESDFITPEERQRHPMYQEVHLPYGAAFVMGARLSSYSNLLTGLGVLRSPVQGHASSDERRDFEALIPHLDAALRLQMSVDGAAASMALGAFNSVAMPVIFCDRSGRVAAASASAEALLSSAQILDAKGRLRAVADASQAAFEHALARALDVTPSTMTKSVVVALRDTTGRIAAEAEIAPLPQTGLFGVGAVMIALRVKREPEPSDLARRFDLTSAEAAVALLAGRGAKAPEIARLRQVSHETVRAQLKAIYSKLSIRGQGELIALLLGH
jgi:DNA-binding CsgD family transcriptional regulator